MITTLLSTLCQCALVFIKLISSYATGVYKLTANKMTLCINVFIGYLTRLKNCFNP